MSGPTPKLAVKLNVLPSPGALSTQIRPCIIDDQRRRDGKSEAGAAELARRRSVGLAEGFEDRVLVFRRDADPGVGDGESQHSGLGCIGRRGLMATSTWPRSVNLMALPTRLTRIWRRRSGSPTRAAGTAGSISTSSSSAF